MSIFLIGDLVKCKKTMVTDGIWTSVKPMRIQINVDQSNSLNSFFSVETIGLVISTYGRDQSCVYVLHDSGSGWIHSALVEHIL